MAVWAEIQYAMLINEKMAAKRMEISSLRKQDEYGRGFRQYHERYPFSEGCFINKPTPFQYKNNRYNQFCENRASGKEALHT